jgi:hypothetical protein
LPALVLGLVPVKSLFYSKTVTINEAGNSDKIIDGHRRRRNIRQLSQFSTKKAKMRTFQLFSTAALSSQDLGEQQYWQTGSLCHANADEGFKNQFFPNVQLATQNTLLVAKKGRMQQTPIKYY